ncbi:MAG: substrate-binding domain-containing protein [Actinobacteria bacterium]|jgi:ribose transport system substrate-binding protein|nr:substrate-binding domain-containing protein [Actinomycetota bacterium]
MTTSLKRSLTAAGAAVVALVLAACGAGENTGTTSSSAAPSASGSSSAASPAEAAAAIIDPLRSPITWPEPTALSKAVDVKGKTIWWVPIGDAVPVIHGFYEGFNQAVTAAGGTVKLCDGKFNPADIGNCLKQAGEQEADAVVTAFVDYAMLPAAFDALTAKNIPVMVAGVPPTGDKTQTENFAFFDPSAHVKRMYETTSAAGIFAVGDSATPNGLWLKLMDSSLTTGSSEAGIAAWKTLCPDCPLATVEYTTANADKIPSAVSAALVQNPDINVIMVPVDSFVPPVTQALKTAGKNDVKIVSTGGDLPNLQNVKAGTQAGDLGTPVIFTGWQYANGLFQLLVGDEVVPDKGLTNRFFDSSNIGELTLTPEAYLSNQWYGDDSYQAAFKSAWGLG